MSSSAIYAADSNRRLKHRNSDIHKSFHYTKLRLALNVQFSLRGIPWGGLGYQALNVMAFSFFESDLYLTRPSSARRPHVWRPAADAV